MHNGPDLVIRGTILGCVMVCLLVALVFSGAGDSQSAALAAASLPAEVASASNTKNAQPSNRALAAVQAARAADVQVEAETKKPAKKNKQANGECSLAASYPQAILQWCGLIEKAARQVDLPPNLIAALILQESGGQPQAYSSSGAVGLMQVMPRDGIASGFQCANGPCFASRPTIAELQDPAFNIDYGTHFLASLVERRGSLREALYAYGPMGMGYYYADKVLGIYEAHAGN
jgi:soluble lytic murein transglycosylase-like protein